MPIHYAPPPPSAFVYTISDNEQEERDASPGLLKGATVHAFGHKVLLEEFWDWDDDDDDDDDDDEV